MVSVAVIVWTVVAKSGCDNAKRTQSLQSTLCAFSSWTDGEYVTGYGVQVVGVFNGNELDYTGSARSLKAFWSVIFLNKVSHAYHLPCLELFANLLISQSSSGSLCTSKLSFSVLEYWRCATTQWILEECVLFDQSSLIKKLLSPLSDWPPSCGGHNGRSYSAFPWNL